MATILVVEDEAEIRKLIREALERENHQVFEASNGQEGVEMFKKRPTDLVLTDMYMPVKGGTDTIIEIKSMSREVKIIAISGGGIFAPSEFLAIAKRHGADCVLSKPIIFDQLVLEIQKLVN